MGGRIPGRAGEAQQEAMAGGGAGEEDPGRAGRGQRNRRESGALEGAGAMASAESIVVEGTMPAEGLVGTARSPEEEASD